MTNGLRTDHGRGSGVNWKCNWVIHSPTTRVEFCSIHPVHPLMFHYVVHPCVVPMLGLCVGTGSWSGATGRIHLSDDDDQGSPPRRRDCRVHGTGRGRPLSLVETGV